MNLFGFALNKMHNVEISISYAFTSIWVEKKKKKKCIHVGTVVEVSSLSHRCAVG